MTKPEKAEMDRLEQQICDQEEWIDYYLEQLENSNVSCFWPELRTQLAYHRGRLRASMAALAELRKSLQHVEG